MELDTFFDFLSIGHGAGKSAFSQARYKLKHQFFIDWNDEFVNAFHQEKENNLRDWKGFHVYGIDGSTLYLFDTKDNREAFGVQKNQSTTVPMARVIAYTLPRWEKLSLYTQDGCLEIDNNMIENSIRPVAIGRKNYLFAGSHDAAQKAAMIYSLLGTCKMKAINPMDWLSDVLNRIQDHPINKLYELLPQNWNKKSH